MNFTMHLHFFAEVLRERKKVVDFYLIKLAVNTEFTRTDTPWRYCRFSFTPPQQSEYHGKANQMNFLVSQCI